MEFRNVTAGYDLETGFYFVIDAELRLDSARGFPATSSALRTAHGVSCQRSNGEAGGTEGVITSNR